MHETNMPMAGLPKVSPSGGRGWLDQWMGYGKERATMTDELMIEATGLFLMASVVARRAYLDLDFTNVYPNLYVMICATSTYFHKSTILRLARGAMEEVAPHLLLPSQMSAEAMMSKLAGQKVANYADLPKDIQEQEIAGMVFGGKRAMIADEASKVLRADYLEAVRDLLLEAYDNPIKIDNEFKKLGRMTVYDPSLSLLFATTPTNLGVIMPDGGADGMLARFAMITPETDRIERVHNKRAGAVQSDFGGVIDGLKAMYQYLPMPTATSFDCMRMGITDEALDAYNEYADFLHVQCEPDSSLDDRLRATYGRLAVMGLKVAMLLALGAGRDVVTGDDWGYAQIIVERWRASAHRVRKDMVYNTESQIQKDIIRYLRGCEYAKTGIEIKNAVGGDGRVVNGVLSALVEGGHLIFEKVGAKKVYHLRYKWLANELFPMKAKNRAPFYALEEPDVIADVQAELKRMGETWKEENDG